jgi:hypothetical protein
LNQPCQHTPAFALAARYVGEVDVDLVYPTVFHEWRNVGDDGFEALRVVAVLVKVDGQQDGVWAEFGGLHHTHGRAHTKFTRCVGGGGDDASACVAR